MLQHSIIHTDRHETNTHLTANTSLLFSLLMKVTGKELRIDNLDNAVIFIPPKLDSSKLEKDQAMFSNCLYTTHGPPLL